MRNLKDVAEKLYIEAGYTGKAISELLDVSENTVSDWNKAGDWKTKRAASGSIQTMSLQIVMNIYKRVNQLTSTAEFNAEELLKLANAKDKFLPKEGDFEHFLKFSNELLSWMAREGKNTDLIKSVAAIFFEYSNAKFGEYEEKA